MAVRFGKGGFQSVPDDPFWNKKKKPAEAIPSPPPPVVPKAPPVVPKAPPVVPSDVPITGNTLADRLAKSGVAPYQPGMGANLSQQLAGIYEGQAGETGMQARLERIQNLPIEQIETALGFTPQGQKPEGQDLAEEILSDAAQRGGGKFAVTMRTAGVAMREVIPDTKSLAAQLIDQLRIGITGKQPLKVSVAEESLNAAMTQIGADIDAVKSGLKPSRDVQTSFILAENALSRLESSQRGVGKENLRIWIDSGKQIEAEILISKQKLDNMKRELLKAMLRLE